MAADAHGHARLVLGRFEDGHVRGFGRDEIDNAVERLAWTQFETHLTSLDDPGDVELLKSVMAEEKFHLNYVEAELERQSKNEHAAVVTAAVDESRTRFAQFNEMRRAETRELVERMLGAGGAA